MDSSTAVSNIRKNEPFDSSSEPRTKSKPRGEDRSDNNNKATLESARDAFRRGICECGKSRDKYEQGSECLATMQVRCCNNIEAGFVTLLPGKQKGGDS
jgi:hypothetical protein